MLRMVQVVFAWYTKIEAQSIRSLRISPLTVHSRRKAEIQGIARFVFLALERA